LNLKDNFISAEINGEVYAVDNGAKKN
jgi:hypothetical protein